MNNSNIERFRNIHKELLKITERQRKAALGPVDIFKSLREDEMAKAAMASKPLDSPCDYFAHHVKINDLVSFENPQIDISEPLQPILVAILLNAKYQRRVFKQNQSLKPLTEQEISECDMNTEADFEYLLKKYGVIT